MALQLHPEWKRLARVVLIVQLVLVASVVLLGWAWLTAAIVIAGVLEAVLVRLLRVSVQLGESEQLLARDREETEAVFHDIRTQRHDFLAHAGAIHYMLEQDRLTEARDYLSRLIGEYDRMNTGMRGEKAHMAAIVLKSMKQAEAAGVRMTLDLAAALSQLPLTSTNQSKLVANILNNALEAAETSGVAQPYVKMTSFISGGLYVLETENSTAPLPDDLIEGLYRSYGKSTKGTGHRGIGTYIIASLVEEAKGHLEFSAVKDRFLLKMKLPVIK